MRRSGEGRKRTETRETTVKLSVAWAGDVANVGTARLLFRIQYGALLAPLVFDLRRSSSLAQDASFSRW